MTYIEPYKVFVKEQVIKDLIEDGEFLGEIMNIDFQSEFILVDVAYEKQRKVELHRYRYSYELEFLG